jgi:hypothetical protein
MPACFDSKTDYHDTNDKESGDLYFLSHDQDLMMVKV